MQADDAADYSEVPEAAVMIPQITNINDIRDGSNDVSIHSMILEIDS
jgi:hypothetical protein